MRTLHLNLCMVCVLSLIFSSADTCAQNTKLELFTVEWVNFEISTNFIKGLKENDKLNKTVTITAVSPVDKLGFMDLESNEFANIHSESLIYDSSNDPFLGKGVSFLIKVKNDKWFYVFYEKHKDNPKVLNGMRVTLNELSRVNNSNELLIFSKYQRGYSFSKKLISEITRLMNLKPGDP
jgi:hypothetical protein